MELSELRPVDHLVRIDDGIATIVIDRPQARNALTAALLASLLDSLRALDAADGVGAIVVTGAGSAFCAGQALDDAPTLARGTGALGTTVVEHYNPLLLALLCATTPTVAAINGSVTGAGLGIALACDVRIAADEARFSTGFAKIGLALDAGVSLLLPRVVGHGRALDLALLGDTIGAPEALAAGLVTRVAPAATLADAARALAARLAAGPASLASIKRELRENGLGDVVGALRREAVAQNDAGRTSDAREGLGAFAAKRAPRFRRR